jgi:hypothetical protein
MSMVGPKDVGRGGLLASFSETKLMVHIEALSVTDLREQYPYLVTAIQGKREVALALIRRSVDMKAPPCGEDFIEICRALGPLSRADQQLLLETCSAGGAAVYLLGGYATWQPEVEFMDLALEKALSNGGQSWRALSRGQGLNAKLWRGERAPSDEVLYWLIENAPGFAGAALEWVWAEGIDDYVVSRAKEYIQERLADLPGDIDLIVTLFTEQNCSTMVFKDFCSVISALDRAVGAVHGREAVEQ